jgi:hypothetical protein
MQSQRLAIAVEALARSYDHIIIDAGAMDDVPLGRLAGFAPRAVLVARTALDSPTTTLARDRLTKAGFAEVSVLVEAPSGPEIGAAGSRAAA